MNEMPAAWVEPLKPWVAPLTRFNQFMVRQMEQWASLQMGSLKAYADLGVAQVRVALKVTDRSSLNEFADSQFAVLEPPGADEAVTVDIDQPLDRLVGAILRQLPAGP